MVDNDRSRMSRRRFLGTAALTGAVLSSGVPATVSAQPSQLSDEVTVHEDITYAEREAGERKTAGTLELDLYLPPGENVAPLIIYIHGGAWTLGSQKDTRGVERFAERGYAVASIEYRLSYIPDDVEPAFWIPEGGNVNGPRGTFPDHIVDVKAAIRWLRAHADEYNLDPDRFATWGSSAGAHLATLAGTMGDIEQVEGSIYDVTPSVYPEESGRIQAVVGWYAGTKLQVMDEQLGEMGLFEHEEPNSPESLLVGGDINLNALKVRRANPLTYVDFNDPSFLLMHGRKDAIVPYEQSEILLEALGRACVDSTLYVLNTLGHGFGFEELAGAPPEEQVIWQAGACDPGEHEGTPPAPEQIEGPPASEEVIDQFLREKLNTADGNPGRGDDNNPGRGEDDNPGRGRGN